MFAGAAGRVFLVLGEPAGTNSGVGMQMWGGGGWRLPNLEAEASAGVQLEEQTSAVLAPLAGAV